MKTRTLKELYEILLDNKINQGICHCISRLYGWGTISLEEHELLLEDFESKKPNMFSKFFWNRNYNHLSRLKHYWWTNDKKGNEQRKLFIQHIIDNL